MKVRSKETQTEAMLYDGSIKSAQEIQAWAHHGLPPAANAIITIDGTGILRVRTNNGPALAKPGEYVIRGVTDFYPCDPDTFARRWEPIPALPPGTRYQPTPRNTDEILDRRFAHHPPKNDQATRYGEIRNHLRETAKFIRDRTPECPEQTRALNALHEAMLLANAAIACNE